MQTKPLGQSRLFGADPRIDDNLVVAPPPLPVTVLNLMSSALISQKSPFGWQMWRGATLELRHSRNFNSSASGGWPERQKESAEAALSQLHTRGDVVQPRA